MSATASRELWGQGRLRAQQRLRAPWWVLAARGWARVCPANVGCGFG